MTDAPEKNDAYVVFINALFDASRVVVQKQNALGDMDEHYIPAQDLREAVTARTHLTTYLSDAAVAAALVGAASIFYEKSSYWSNLCNDVLRVEYDGYAREIESLIPTTAADALERYAEKVRAEERERCARIVSASGSPGMSHTASMIRGGDQ